MTSGHETLEGLHFIPNLQQNKDLWIGLLVEEFLNWISFLASRPFRRYFYWKLNKNLLGLTFHGDLQTEEYRKRKHILG